MDDSHPSCPYPSHAPPARIPLTVMPDHDCAYLPGRVATSRAFWASSGLSPGLYHGLMDSAFRRSGRLIYQPICRSCRECVPIRLQVDAFVQSKSQRRAWRRNQDLSIGIQDPEPTDEKFELYRRYQMDWHGKADGEDRASFESFLYDSPVSTVEFTYRNASGRLVGGGDLRCQGR